MKNYIRFKKNYELTLINNSVMEIYNKLTEDLQNLVIFHLNKHLNIHYLNEISTKLYFSDVCKLHVKKNINILIKNIKEFKIGV